MNVLVLNSISLVWQGDVNKGSGEEKGKEGLVSKYLVLINRQRLLESVNKATNKVAL